MRQGGGDTDGDAGLTAAGACFLCGADLNPSDKIDSGHILPRAFVPRAYRSQLSGAGLPAYPVHRACNARLSTSEEWVLHDLGKAAAGPIGDALRADLKHAYESHGPSRKRYDAIKAQWQDYSRLWIPGGVPTPYHPAHADACLASIRLAAWRQLLLPVVVEGDRLDLMGDSRRVARLT